MFRVHFASFLMVHSDLFWPFTFIIDCPVRRIKADKTPLKLSSVACPILNVHIDLFWPSTVIICFHRPLWTQQGLDWNLSLRCYLSVRTSRVEHPKLTFGINVHFRSTVHFLLLTCSFHTNTLSRPISRCNCSFHISSIFPFVKT